MSKDDKKRQVSIAKKKSKRVEKKNVELKRLQAKEIKEKYPEFIFADYDKNIVSGEFVSAVKAELAAFDYECPKHVGDRDRLIFKNIKKFGIDAVEKMLSGNIPEDKQKIFKPYYQMYVGTWVYKNLQAKGLLHNFLPYHDCQLTLDQNHHIRFNALSLVNTPKGRAYFSSKSPKIDVDGGQFIVAFSRHALERIAERCVFDWMRYGGAGDVFAYINHCTYYELCTVTHDEEIVPAFTFYDICTPGFASHKYVDELILAPDNNMHYHYRVGYCPIGFYKNYARAITLLTPGMKGTPEWTLLNTIKNVDKKLEIEKGVQNITSFKALMETNDFSAVRWFHEKVTSVNVV